MDPAAAAVQSGGADLLVAMNASIFVGDAQSRVPPFSRKHEHVTPLFADVHGTV